MRRLIALTIMLSSLALRAGVPVRWTAETSRVQPHMLEAWRGDTLDLECTLASYGQRVAPGAATASFMWQTNGMGTAWWQTNATISADGVIAATWSPSMDPGGAEVAFFMPVVAGDGSSYRAAGRIRFRPSPGAGSRTVELPQPGGTLDFGAFQLVNAPWATLAAANEAIAAAVTSATGAIVIPPAVDLGPYATTGYVAGAITSATGAIVIPPLVDLSPYATTSGVAAAIYGSSNNLARSIQAVSNAAMPRAEMSTYATLSAVSDAIAAIPIPSLAGYATEQWTALYFSTNYTPPDLSSYASRAYADAAASNAEATAIAAIPSLAGYATEGYVADYFATNYTPPDLSSYASRAYADAAASNAEATAIAAIPSLAGYATQQYVAEYFSTNTPPIDLSPYASRSYADSVASNAQAAAEAAIPSLEGYATQSYVADYVATNLPSIDLAPYATRSYADAAASNAQASAISAIPSLAGYATQSYVADYVSTNLPSIDLAPYATRSYADAVASNAQVSAIAAIPSLEGYATQQYVANYFDDRFDQGIVIESQTTRLATPDGYTWQDATGVVWQVELVYGWSGNIWTNSQDYSASSTGFTFQVTFLPDGSGVYTNAAFGSMQFMEMGWLCKPESDVYIYNDNGTANTNIFSASALEYASNHWYSANLSYVPIGTANTNVIRRVAYAGEIKSNQISDGTNAIDAARNVYTIYKDAWRTGDWSNIFTNRAGTLEWHSIYQVVYAGELQPAGYVTWEENAMGYFGGEGPGWYVNYSEPGTPTDVYPGGTNATDLNSGFLVRGDWTVPVGRLTTDDEVTAQITESISTLEEMGTVLGARALMGEGIVEDVTATDVWNAYASATNYTDTATNEVLQAALRAASEQLAGQTFDFSDMRGVFLSLSNIIHVLGGSVTNFPTFNQ